jgi:hypothetical protein
MNINSLLPKDAHNQRRFEVTALTNKWQRTGLLEGLSDLDRGNMSQLLENQAKQLVVEANRTGTSAGSEEWAGIALPLIRRIFGEITAKEFVSVQPMNLPSGLVFWLEFKYGTGQPGYNTGSGKNSQEDSIWGVTDARKGAEVATGGLYGEGRFAYTINDYNVSGLYATQSVSPSAETGSLVAANLTTDINFDTEFSASVVDPDQLFLLTVRSADLVNPDLEGVRAFTVSATGIETQFNQFTKVSNDGSLITFLVSGSGAAAGNLTVYYQKQPTDITRGDFEEGKTGDDPLDIPSLNLEFHSQALTAKTRKLKAQWTPEFAQDINAYQNIDAEAELTGILGEYVAREIDLEILDMLRLNAQTTDYWSARLGYQFDSTTQTFQSINANAAAYNQGTWFQTLGTKIQKLSNEIDRLTLRGGANFLVTSPRIATILESIPGYAADTDGSKSQFSMGSRKVGMLNSRFTVYKSPYMKENVILMGYRGTQYLETGAVYAPYIPLIMTPLIHDPDNFTPRKAVMTRYAKEMLRPEFYGKIFVEGLDTI